MHKTKTAICRIWVVAQTHKHVNPNQPSMPVLTML